METKIFLKVQYITILATSYYIHFLNHRSPSRHEIPSFRHEVGTTYNHENIPIFLQYSVIICYKTVTNVTELISPCSIYVKLLC